MVRRTVSVVVMLAVLCASRSFAAFCPSTPPASAVWQRSPAWCWAANLQYLSYGFSGGCETLQCEFVNFFRDLQLLPDGTCCVVGHCDSYAPTVSEYSQGMFSFGFSISTIGPDELLAPPAPADLKAIVCDNSRKLLAIFGDPAVGNPSSVTSGHAGTIVAMDVASISGSSLVRVMDSLIGDHRDVTHNDLVNGTGVMPYPWLGYWIVYGVNCSTPGIGDVSYLWVEEVLSGWWVKLAYDVYWTASEYDSSCLYVSDNPDGPFRRAVADKPLTFPLPYAAGGEQRLSSGRSRRRSGSRGWEHAEPPWSRSPALERAVADRTTSGEIDRRERSLQTVHLALVQLAKAIAEGDIRMTMSDLTKLIRLEAFLSDEPESRNELVLHELSAKSDSELREMVRRELDVLRSLGSAAE
jgi:hypothetical protein